MFFRIDTQNNTYYISKHHIRYVQCHKKNEAIPRSSVVPESDATAVEIFMSEGRRTFLFTKEEYDSKTTVELEDY